MEYGRNIQKLIKYAITIENVEQRTHFTKAIVHLMGQMHPHLRNIEEFQSKLWAQLYVISEFKLDVDVPFEHPTEEQLNEKPDSVPYPQTRIRFRHYGKNVERLIQKAIKMEDGSKKDVFIKVIANYMKMVYNNWNRENVSDELIKADLVLLSEGQLELGEDVSLDSSSSQQQQPQQQNNYSNNNNNNYSYNRQKKKRDYNNNYQRNNNNNNNNNNNTRYSNNRYGNNNNRYSNNNNNNRYNNRNNNNNRYNNNNNGNNNNRNNRYNNKRNYD